MFDKILVAIDLDPEDADIVIGRAISLGQGRSTGSAGAGKASELWVTHIVEPQFVQYSVDPTFTGSLTQAMEEDAINAARKRLKEVCAPHGIPEDHQLVSIGRAAEQIHEAATKNSVDTIIIGSQVKRGLARLLGSTANSVLHNAPVNVLTVRITS